MTVSVANWKNVSPIIGLQSVTEISTTQQFPLGTLAKFRHETYGEGEFMYVLGVASAVTGSWVLISEDNYATSLLAANDIGRVGVLMGALVASTYGWAQVRGKAVGKAATVADNGNVYSTATAGTADDAIVAGDRIKKAKWASADGTPSAGLAEVEIDNPFVDDALAA